MQPVEPKPQPRVTAVVVSYNSAAALRRCLNALERSTGRENLEILVVDKGSRDESPRLDAEFPEITILRLPRNFGNTKALNIAMRTAAAELVFFVVPEIEVEPGAVSLLADHLEAANDAVAVCPVLRQGQFYRLPEPPDGARLTPIEVGSDAEAVPVEGATFDAMMARKYFIRGLNYLDEKYGEFWSDVELSYQIRRAGKKVFAIPGAHVTYTPAPDPYPPAAEAALAADRISGAARFFGKHYGMAAGWKLRLGAILSALFSMRLRLFAALVTGRKIDGTQTEF